MTHHLVVTGTRRARMTVLAEAELYASCHARHGGPYAGIAEILHELVPDAHRRAPGLTSAHRIELLCAVPELANAIGAAPDTLVTTTPHDERTRFFGHSLIRAMSQGIVTFLIAYARLRERPLTLALDDVNAAEPTARELVAILLRRAAPDTLRVAVGAATPMPELERYAQAVAPALPPAAPDRRTPGARLRAFIASDGTSDDPAEAGAYDAADPALRARLHDERADALEARADWARRLGPIPYHRERGSDPSGAGRRALRTALERCVAIGFSAATVDFGMRGRAVCDPVSHQQDYCHFSGKAASALVPLGRIDECHEIYRELRRRYPLPRVQMTCSYAIAMLYTRFNEPRDHDAALEWVNNARALASLEPDPVEAAYLQVFEDNGLALIEMHRGDLARSLELVDLGIERLERELPDDRYIVHRSQLLHNRARVLSALGRLDEAQADFERLLEWDPNYVEYHTDRANLARRRGDLATALAEYDRAVAVSPPLPDLFYNRATVRTQAGLANEALDDLDLVLEMEPDTLHARLARGTLRLEQGDAAGALADARAGIADHPGHAALHCLLALALGCAPDARAAFARALELDPGFMPALVNGAVLEFELGEPGAAVALLTRALELGGDDPDVLFNRGFALQATGDVAGAARDFERALALPGADRELLLDQLGRCRALADVR